MITIVPSITNRENNGLIGNLSDVTKYVVSVIG